MKLDLICCTLIVTSGFIHKITKESHFICRQRIIQLQYIRVLLGSCNWSYETKVQTNLRTIYLANCKLIYSEKNHLARFHFRHACTQSVSDERLSNLKACTRHYRKQQSNKTACDSCFEWNTFFSFLFLSLSLSPPSLLSLIIRYSENIGSNS